MKGLIIVMACLTIIGAPVVVGWLLRKRCEENAALSAIVVNTWDCEDDNDNTAFWMAAVL